MDSRTRFSVLISSHRRLRDRDSRRPSSRSRRPGCRPRGRDVGAALLRDPPAHLHVRRLRQNPAAQPVPAPSGTTLRLRSGPGARTRTTCRDRPDRPPSSSSSAAGCRTGTPRSRAPCAGVASRSSRYSPYLRPSAAICTTVSVESRLDLRRGIRRADVVRLVDDDQAGLSRVPRPPQRRQDGLGDEPLLRCRAERPQVDHRAPGRGVSQLRDERGLLRVPDAPVQQADVARPQAQRPSPREVGTASCAMSLISGSPSFWRRSSPPSAAYSSRSRTGSKPRTAAWVDGSKSAKRSRSGRSASESSRHTATSFVTRA